MITKVKQANALWMGGISTSTPSLPTISSFSATPTSITSGGSATLSWSESGATSLSLNNGIGDVTGLSSKSVSPATTTSYTLTATNSSGSVTANTTVTVSAPIDVTPPIISNIAVSSITPTSSVVSWTTDEPASSAVDYGLTTSYGASTSLGTSLTLSHSIMLSNLSSSSSYHFRVDSSDSSGNLAQSSDNSFTTSIDPNTNQAPAAITNLSPSQPTKTSIKLSWTAPGSSGNTGTASAYDIRYSTSPITEANWSAALSVSGEPAPTLAGTIQSYTLVGLIQGTKYYAAMKTSNSQGLTSTLSNVVSFTTKVKGR